MGVIKPWNVEPDLESALVMGVVLLCLHSLLHSLLMVTLMIFRAPVSSWSMNTLFQLLYLLVKKLDVVSGLLTNGGFIEL